MKPTLTPGPGPQEFPPLKLVPPQAVNTFRRYYLKLAGGFWVVFSSGELWFSCLPMSLVLAEVNSLLDLKFVGFQFCIPFFSYCDNGSDGFQTPYMLD